MPGKPTNFMEEFRKVIASEPPRTGKPENWPPFKMKAVWGTSNFSVKQRKHVPSLSSWQVNTNSWGRIALTANFLTNKIPIVYTHDQELFAYKNVTWKNFTITFKDPLAET